MITTRWLPEALLLFLALALEGHRRWQFGALGQSTSLPPTTSTFWSLDRKLAARERTRNLWYHGFDNYMQHGAFVILS